MRLIRLSVSSSVRPLNVPNDCALTYILTAYKLSQFELEVVFQHQKRSDVPNDFRSHIWNLKQLSLIFACAWLELSVVSRR